MKELFRYSIRYEAPKIETRLYRIYKKMKARCYNPKKDGYKYYGGRGIKVCEEWKENITGYPAFYEWAIANGYKKELTLDRKNSNWDYFPENCRWISKTMNSRYKSSTKMNLDKIRTIRALYATRAFSVQDLSDTYKICVSNIYSIVKYRTWKDVK